MSRITSKVVSDINKLLELTELKERIEAKGVQVSVDSKGELVSSVQCLVCNKSVALSANKYAIAITNFKRHHFASQHLEKDLEEGTLAKLKKTQPKVTIFFVKKPKPIEDAAGKNESTESETAEVDKATRK